MFPRFFTNSSMKVGECWQKIRFYNFFSIMYTIISDVFTRVRKFRQQLYILSLCRVKSVRAWAQSDHFPAELLSREFFTKHPDPWGCHGRFSTRKVLQSGTTDTQHPLGWVPFEVSSPIHLNVQLSILQNWALTYFEKWRWFFFS